MVTPLINALLAWLHIFTSIGWMGTAMFLVMVMGPTMPNLSPPTREELIVKLLPKLARYVAVFATLTLLFGVMLALGKAAGRPELLAPTNTWGLRVTVGATLGGIGYFLALAVVLPSVRRMAKVVLECQAQQNLQKGPPRELMRLQKRVRLASTTVLLLLTLVLIFMVIAARL